MSFPDTVDRLRRPLRDLRISVTDRCNLRCSYCMPRAIFDERHSFLPRAELLSFEEVSRVAELFVRLGVQKIRLTGGEPLMRHGIERLVEKLARLRCSSGKPVELALTTNGILLAAKARALKEAGLSRVSVSLDGLTDDVFRRMTDSNARVASVLDGIAAAVAAELMPIKVNMVVKRGVNDHQVVPMAEHFRNTGIVLRFIEYMDVGCSNGWTLKDVITSREVLAKVRSVYTLLPGDPAYRGEVARRWHYADGSGEIGLISSVSGAFCGDCTRARLATDGKLYSCLFATQGLDLRAPLRDGADDESLIRLIAEQWQRRDDRYSELRGEAHCVPGKKIEMSYIGG